MHVPEVAVKPKAAVDALAPRPGDPISFEGTPNEESVSNAPSPSRRRLAALLLRFAGV
jgi:hypothetical protein